MKMTFHAGAKEDILFDGWSPRTWPAMLGSCICVLVMALAYEGLKALRLWLLERSVNNRRAQSAVGSTDSATSLAEDNLPITVAPPSWRFNWSRNRLLIAAHCLQAFLHLLQVTLGYMLMLIAMTYNVYLFISVVLGAALGYLIFNFRRPIIVDKNEQCH